MAANRAAVMTRPQPDSQDRQRSWSTQVHERLGADDDLFAGDELPAPTRSARRLTMVADPEAEAPPRSTRPTRAVGPQAVVEPLPTRVVAIDPAPARRTVARPAVAPLLGNLRLAALGATALLAVVAVYVVVSTIVHWVQITTDDLAYGRPRTTQMDAVVGHADSPAQPTHFIALNLNRQISIFEIPGGDTGKAQVITGPYLFGDGEDLTPIHLETKDVNGDGKPDLIVSANAEQVVYINDNGTFRAMTADETIHLEQQAAAGLAPQTQR